MHSAYKLQPSSFTLFSLGIKIIEDSHKKTGTMSGPIEVKNIYHQNRWASYMFICPSLLISNADTMDIFHIAVSIVIREPCTCMAIHHGLISHIVTVLSSKTMRLCLFKHTIF